MGIADPVCRLQAFQAILPWIEAAWAEKQSKLVGQCFPSRRMPGCGVVDTEQAAATTVDLLGCVSSAVCPR